ncbi:3-oxoacyl-ACP reductase family protein [Rhodoferax sp. GW822-FHT02A01]|uniref:SDR family NAD(P)-dependent oxidoreductase n=1 Tax=Rhodoferax sp. GW822-FHT02A01 TaxID=3141537 RepID=UPI00315C580C
MSAPHTMNLQGRTALITGAATGIGRATALLFAQAGATVVVNHLGRAEAAQEVVRQITAHGGKAWMVEADVTHASAVSAMVAQVQSVGPIDILLNNAGIIQEKPFLETTEDDWDRMLDVDLKSVFLMCRAVLPVMVAQGQGVVINTASDLGYLGRAQFAPYCAAKAGVIGLTRSLAREFAPAIRINAIAPGPVDTAMVSLESMSAETIELELAIPQHRFAQPEEIAATALFLASDLSRFYCGQVLGPNGGSVMP